MVHYERFDAARSFALPLCGDMDGRRPLSSQRQARKEAASPYARPAASTAQRAPATPSRLGAMLSFLSPFRRRQQQQQQQQQQGHASPAARQPSPLAPAVHDDDNDDDDDVVDDQHSQMDQDSAPDEPVREQEHSHTLASTRAPRVYPSLPVMSPSFSMPNLSASTSRLLVTEEQRQSNFDAQSEESIRTSPQRANEELANFFREKAQRGGEPLTPIEQAGVLHLMQQAQAENNVSTAFTPQFKALSGSQSMASLPRSSSLQMFPSTGSAYGSPAPSSQSPANGFRRRRPIYVGAGYSSASARRRRTAGNASEALSRSHSDMSLGSPVADGKRRRMDNDEHDDASVAPPTTSLSTLPPPSPVQSTSVTSPKPAIPATFSRLTSQSTPVKPSPLWQVSKAATPLPSPAKNESLQIQEQPTPVKAPTRAADIVMGVIKDDLKPKTASFLVIRQEVLNPYDSIDSPMPRIPRSRPAKPATPRRTPARKAAQTPAATPARELSASEQLEKTMPQELRRKDTKRTKVPEQESYEPTPEPDDAPLPVFKKSTKQTDKPKPKPKSKSKAPIDVMELSDSDEQDVEDEHESESPLADPNTKATKAKADAPKPMTPAQVDSPAPKKASAFSFMPSATPPDHKKANNSTDRSSIAANATGFGASSAFGSGGAPAPAANPFASLAKSEESSASNPLPTTTAETTPKTVSSSFTFSSKAVEPEPTVKPAPASAPTSAFSFSVPTGAATTALPPSKPFSDSKTDAASPSSSQPAQSLGVLVDDGRKAALVAQKLTLPRVSFSDAFAGCESAGDASARAVMDVVKAMSKSELPTFAL
ncbi:hypothetical protein OIV83_004349 [Microbotryomycetes sp. JL201]|nr:hypothetical protein OIV83_004276 [Microbotryomycetes sp. JL201]KAK4049200.1 hypothetical protein OIV83_004349 [Microbotryomycetes sp. JL201]